MTGIDTSHRHPSTQQIARWFDYGHLTGSARTISADCADLASEILNAIPEDSPELVAGLRKLLEAKDCFVRAAIASAELVIGGTA